MGRQPISNYTTNPMVWIITIGLVIVAIVLAILTYKTTKIINKAFTSNCNRYTDSIDYHDIHPPHPNANERFKVISSGLQGEASIEGLDNAFNMLTDELTKWQVEGKRKIRRNKITPSDELAKLMNNVSAYIDSHSKIPINEKPETDTVNFRKNELLDIVNKNLQLYNGSKPDDSGKYTYTTNNKMYTYNDDHNSTQTTYDAKTKMYTTTAADNSVTLMYDEKNTGKEDIDKESNKYTQSSENKSADKKAESDGIKDVNRSKGDIIYSSTFTEPDYNIVITPDIMNDNKENFSNNPSHIIEDHIVNILKIIHDKYVS
jgi:hypothetical protein